MVMLLMVKMLMAMVVMMVMNMTGVRLVVVKMVMNVTGEMLMMVVRIDVWWTVIGILLVVTLVDLMDVVV